MATAEKIARWIDMTAVSGLILALGLLGLYLEFKTPGFGVFGISGIALLAVWFWGHNVAGLAGIEELALFAVGIILVGLEIFVIPGFGIAGISGIALIVVSLLMAMVQHYPGGSWHPPEMHLREAIKTMGVALATCVGLMGVLVRILPETPLFRRLMLTSAMPKEEGYSASSEKSGLVGLKGVAETDLHPGGVAAIDGKRQSVVSRGEFIDAGARIVVAEAHGNRIVVDELANRETS